MKKIFTNTMAIIGTVTMIAMLVIAAFNVKGYFDGKSAMRKSNEYVYTQVDEFMEDNHGDRRITLERCSNGEIKITYNNGHVDRKFDFVRNDGTIDEY